MVDNELFYLKKGEGSEVVILLHGLFGSAKNLNAIANALAERYTVYAIDLPNHGQSAHVKEMTLDSMAQAIISFADNHQLERFAIFGHSLGGKVAMVMALRYPARVRAVAVGDIAPITYQDKHAKILRALEFASEQKIESRQQADLRLAERIGEVGIRQFLLHSLHRHGDAYQWRFNLEQIALSYPQLCEFLEPGSSSYDGPALFLRGEKSNYIIESNQAVIDQFFPNNDVRTVVGAGHWLHADKPQLVNELLMSFFDNLVA